MTPEPDLRLAFSAALERMREAHNALAAKVCSETLAAYERACGEARRAFEKMVAAGYERAQGRRFGW